MESFVITTNLDIKMTLNTDSLLDTADFYDEVMCGEIPIGEARLLKVLDDDCEVIGITVGVADCWPISVTDLYGQLHGVSDLDLFLSSDTEVTIDNLKAAIALAKENGLNINPVFLSLQ